MRVLKECCSMLKLYGSKGREVKAHAMESYSPPRVVAMAAKIDMIRGLSMDLTTIDQDDGKPWDFNDKEKRVKIRNNGEEQDGPPAGCESNVCCIQQVAELELQ